MKQLSELNFYATPEHSCSYIDNRQAKTLFIDPKQPIDNNTYTQLSELGFRRSGTHVYRPHCENCQACVSIRLPVEHFKMSRSQRRIYNKNSDISVTQVEAVYTDEYYQLYENYINIRHMDGDMYPPSKKQFEGFLLTSNQLSAFLEFRLSDGKLVAIASIDILTDSLSAVYTFFDPLLTKRSLGTFAILWQILHTQNIQMKYLYLGYWVKDCQKMRYKTDFTPLELLINGRWLAAQ